MDKAALSARISAEAGHTEFLFYRVSPADEFDWILGAGQEGYEMFCTACGQGFFEPRDRGRPAKRYRRCPRCGAAVVPSRWRDRGKLENVQFAYHVFQRGEGAEVWLRSWQVRMERDFTSQKYDLFEYCRVLFRPGGAHRWTRGRSWCFGVSQWKPVQSIRLKRWHSGYGYTRDDCWAGVTMEEMQGSCLEYAPMDEIMALDLEPVELLGLWCRYPAAEYVWKMGFARFFEDRAHGYGREFARVVNLRATGPDRLFPRLDRGELRLLRRDRARMDLAAIDLYQRLKAAGAADRGAAGMDFAAAVRRSHLDFFALAQRCGAAPKELRRYLQRQAGRREGADIAGAMQELDDYLDQLERLGIRDGTRLPHDLHETHRRLSARERQLRNRPLNAQFRARRRLLRWMRWKHGGLFIRPVDSAEEITREGEQMSNCVAGYAQRHAAGKTVILVLRKCSAPGMSWHTVEIDLETLTCKQCYAAHNQARTPEAAAFMQAYLAHLQEARPGRRKGHKDGRRERSAA